MTKHHFITKYLFIHSILILLFSTNIFAKNATVHITVKNFLGKIAVHDPGLRYDLTKNKVAYLQLDAHQSVLYTIDIDKPNYLVLYFSSNYYCLFLSPGDDLFFTADFSKKNNPITVTGKGSNNNQPAIFVLTDMDMQPFKDDAAPNRVIAALKKQYLLNKGLLANYIKVYKPSSAFIKTATANLQYFIPWNFYTSMHTNIYGKPKGQQLKWENIRDSLFLTAKLNNEGALTAYNYTQLIDFFVLWEAGGLWIESKVQPTSFYEKWFHTNSTRGKKLFNTAQTGILNTFIIDKYFTGKAAEYAYCQAIKYVYNEADYPSAILLFNHLKKRYPASVYIKTFSSPMAVVINKQRQALNSKIVFLTDNGTKLNTFKEIIALNKGKTVFIDMWGTWCGPCREEIEKNASRLSTYFKSKNVVFLYIANFDTGREEEWKKQIAYFQIEGKHILANSKLTEDVMGKVKSTGYPTYIIIKKDGSYKQTITKYPVKIEAMIKEIEAAEK